MFFSFLEKATVHNEDKGERGRKVYTAKKSPLQVETHSGSTVVAKLLGEKGPKKSFCIDRGKIFSRY